MKGGRKERPNADTTRWLVALGGLLVGLAAGGAAAAPRAFVASSGNDLNPCTLQQPCRGFAAAIAAADAGGEVVVLDSAGYGPVTIGKSVSIVAPPGVYAGVSVSSGDGITVDGAGIHVALKGLAINGQGGAFGIVFLQGASLVVERCTATGFGAHGIRIEAPALAVISDSVASGNHDYGISVVGDATVSITRSRLESNGFHGLHVEGAANVTVDHTVISNNGTNGLNVIRSLAGTARVAVDSSTMTGQGIGSGVLAVAVGGASVARVDITRSTIARNPYGLYANALTGATTIVSITDSDVANNANNGITANNAGTSVRATGNRVIGNSGFGFAQSSGGVLYTPATNYVRDNGTDDGGHTADVLL